MSKEPHLFVDSCIPSETAGDSTLSVTRSFYPELCPFEVMDMIETEEPITGEMIIQFDDNEYGRVTPDCLKLIVERLKDAEKERDNLQSRIDTFKALAEDM